MESKTNSVPTKLELELGLSLAKIFYFYSIKIWQKVTEIIILVIGKFGFEYNQRIFLINLIYWVFNNG